MAQPPNNNPPGPPLLWHLLPGVQDPPYVDPELALGPVNPPNTPRRWMARRTALKPYAEMAEAPVEGKMVCKNCNHEFTVTLDFPTEQQLRELPIPVNRQREPCHQCNHPNSVWPKAGEYNYFFLLISGWLYRMNIDERANYLVLYNPVRVPKPVEVNSVFNKMMADLFPPPPPPPEN